MGILDPQSMNPFLQMKCDVYFAEESQDKYGNVNKIWSMYRTVLCTFSTPGYKTYKGNFAFDDQEFYRLKNNLWGRTALDIRKDDSGQYYPLSHILVTNIRSANCEDELLYINTNGNYAGQPILFEIGTINPYVGPFNKIEYYNIELMRSDMQELLND